MGYLIRLGFGQSVVARGLFLTGIALVFLSGCGPASRFTAEEAGYYEEAGPLGTAACAVGTRNVATLVSATYYDDNGVYSSTRESYTVRRLEVPARGQLAPDAITRWSGIAQSFQTLLPPSEAESFHLAVRRIISSQLSLIQAQGADEAAEREIELGVVAAIACKEYNAFIERVMLRPLPATNGPVLGVSYSPPGVPMSVGLNSRGRFSVAVSDSINTPVGSFSASLAPPDATWPKRLIIAADGYERRFLLDRPFKVFVPTSFGVDVSSDGSFLRVEVVNERANT